MIGVFDSGIGGFNSYVELRRLLPRADIAYLADRRNAPYGTKGEKALISLVSADIKRLCDIGADRILIACCTASTVFEELSPAAKAITLPIISPAAAVAAKGKSIAVIATRRTVSCGAFGKELRKINPSCHVSEIPAQELVSLVERGAKDGKLTAAAKAALDLTAERIRSTAADTLILGCTHFSHLEGELSQRLPGVRIVSPAREGARAMAQLYKYESSGILRERGRTVYIE